MDTKEAFSCPRIAERTGFDRRIVERQRERARDADELNMLDELWVEEGEAGKLILKDKLCQSFSFSCEQHLNSHLYQQLAHVQHHHLVEVHHEELVCGCQLCPLACKLPVKVAHVFPVPLIGIKIIFIYKTIFHSFTENPNNVCL